MKSAGPAQDYPVPVLYSLVLALTCASYFLFPGHTILQSDTQIYIPILEHIWDPTVLTRDIIATRPHVSFTLYDETALLLRWISGASFETVLQGQQFVYRAIGVVSLYYLARAMRHRREAALAITAIVSLGASILAPAVLTVEYEPVPRGFSLPFVLGSLAAIAHGRTLLAAAAATVALGFHPPTAMAYCAMLGLWLLKTRSYGAAAALAVGPAIMLATVAASGLPAERQPFFSSIAPELEALQRMRAAYNWVSIWFTRWVWHYSILLAVACLALWRQREPIGPLLRAFFAGLLAIGVLSVPLSYLLLEKAKWILVPQFQPGRYLLFITLLAGLLCASRAAFALAAGHRLEAFGFFIIAFLIPMEPNVSDLLPPPDLDSWRNAGLAALLTLIFIAALDIRRWKLSAALGALACFIPFVAIPALGRVRNYPSLHSAEIDELARWARAETPKDAMFQFAGFGRDLTPGVFRARALRAVFADWKGGGQANFLPEFATQWHERWIAVEQARTPEEYLALRVNYVVYKPEDARSRTQTAFKNARFVVVRTGPETP